MEGVAFSSGATQGGVLLKHIPYLPSASSSLGGVGLTGVGDGPKGSKVPVRGDQVGLGDVMVGGSEGTDSKAESLVMSEEITELEQKLKVSIRQYFFVAVHIWCIIIIV